MTTKARHGSYLDCAHPREMRYSTPAVDARGGRWACAACGVYSYEFEEHNGAPGRAYVEQVFGGYVEDEIPELQRRHERWEQHCEQLARERGWERLSLRNKLRVMQGRRLTETQRREPERLQETTA